MFNDSVNVQINGWVEIWEEVRGKRTLIFSRKNTVQTNAKKILSRCIGSDSNYFIDRIQAYKAAVLLSSKPMILTEFPTPDDDKVAFSAEFLTGDFNDTLDELRLISIVGGDFSKITGLSITKDASTKLVVKWQITISTL